MSRTFLPLCLLALLASGCDSDCADTSRLNGTYAMWHNVVNVGGSGTATVSDNYPSYQMFINGWSKWKIKASTSSGSFNTDITDVAEAQGDYNEGDATTQAFGGTLTATETDCNQFDLHMEGDFETTVDTVHSFTYDATLLYVGDHVSGTFTYADSFTGTDADGASISGALTDAEGEVSGTLQDGGFDTGFAD